MNILLAIFLLVVADDAEKLVEEVYGADIKAARTPADRIRIATKMIGTAEGSRPAEKYALLVRARELAIAAGDSAVGVQAVEALVDGFTPEKPQDAASWARDGHGLWNDALDKRPPGRLTAQLEAAESYLRALPGLKGFPRVAVEGRLRELGWRVSPIDFNFDTSVEGWTAENHITDLAVKDGCLMGRISGGDPYLVCKNLNVRGSGCPVIEIRMAVTRARRAQFFWTTTDSARWGEDKFLWLAVTGDGEMRTYRINVATQRNWIGQTITGLRVDPGEWEHRSEQSEEFSIDFIRGVLH